MKIAIIGKGNVGSHLYEALRISKDNLINIIDSRSLAGLEDHGFDLLVIAVSDSAINAVASSINRLYPHLESVVVHTAGSVSMDILSPYFKNYGVLYPLQTFSKSIPISSYEEIPVFVEGNNEISYQIIKQTAADIFRNIYPLDSRNREVLHLASVFACNFVNALYCISEDILTSEGIPFNVAHALISQTASKVLTHSPQQCQTGPAVRNDVKVMEKHLELLKKMNHDSELSTLYKLISNYIIRSHREQNRL